MTPVAFILVGILRFYRRGISPLKYFLLGPNAGCRFVPSCSAYALEAVTCHGALRGSRLATQRLCRCHPWGGTGEDPVPSVVKPLLNRTP